MSKSEYMKIVNYFNTISGFKIHLRKEMDLKQGYYDDFLDKKLVGLVLEINQKTLCIV